ncbi:MAG: protease inhibitor I42 family protein [Geminicoccaceae bacterium]
MPENPTTGYRWVMTVSPAHCLEIGSDAFERETGAAPGAGGVRVIGIASVTMSECGLSLAYRRPWETEAPAASLLEFRFVTP